MIALRSALAFAAAVASAHAATGRAPLPSALSEPAMTAPAIESPVTAALVHAYGSRELVEFETALAANLDAAIAGDACDTLRPLADAAVVREPQSIGARYVRMRCANARGDGIDISADARAEFATALRAAEQAAGEYAPDRVVAVNSLSDIRVYLLARREQAAAATIEVEGGGQRLYYVVSATSAGSDARPVVRFDLGGFVRPFIAAQRAPGGADALRFPEMPAFEFARVLSKIPAYRSAALTGLARFSSTLPGASLADERLRGALAEAAGIGTDVCYAALWLAYAELVGTPDAAAVERAVASARVAAGQLAEGDVLLAAIAETGTGQPRSRRDRDAALERAARRIGEPAAQYRLAELLLRRTWALYDEKRGHEWLERAARGGNATAQWRHGSECGPNNYRCSLPWFEKSAQQSSTVALRILGRHYLVGSGVPVEAVRAREYFEQALALGDGDAASTLGEIYWNGDGVPRDRARAVDLFRRGAQWGDPRAQVNFATALRDGSDVAADPAQSLRWYKAAVRQGDKRAMVGWGRALEQGNATEKDEARARELYEWAAQGGEKEAMRRLAAMYRDGRGGDADAAKAASWQRRADEARRTP